MGVLISRVKGGRLSTNTRVGVGIVGLGRMGMVYAQDLAYRVRQANLVAACDIRPEVESGSKETGDSQMVLALSGADR